MLKKAIVITTLGVIALAVNGLSQGEKKGGSGRGYPILQPQMTVEKGTYDAPMGKLGEAPAQPWSATTVGAAVDGKPNPGATKTLVGEIVDFSCYLQVGKHGEKHRACGQKCFTNGQPIGLLTKDGNLYMLMEEEHDPRRDGLTDFRKAATDHVAHIMEVTGTQSSYAGYKALFVTGYLKK
ncbi:MAG TPA: hypothetical protein VGZ47_11990 [Gemmataceae bacterium]|nr:hypothetical protein [Gemmataceae bacterium]